MPPPTRARRPGSELFRVVPVTVVIFAIAVLGCSALEGASRGGTPVLAMLAVFLVVILLSG